MGVANGKVVLASERGSYNETELGNIPYLQVIFEGSFLFTKSSQVVKNQREEFEPFENLNTSSPSSVRTANQKNWTSQKSTAMVSMPFYKYFGTNMYTSSV